MYSISRLSQLFFIGFFVVIAIVVALSFYKYLVTRDYYLTVEVPCDPAFESCFVYECDPTVDDECPLDQDEWIQYYKLLHINARNVPACDSADDECPAPSCIADAGCTEITCSVDENSASDELCAGPWGSAQAP